MLVTWRPTAATHPAGRHVRGIWLAILVGYFVVWALDGPAWRASPGKSIEQADWYQFFRAAGYLPTWLTIALAMLLHDQPWRAHRRRTTGGPPAGACGPTGTRALVVASAATVSGIVAELLKLIVARERPGPAGEHIYRPIFSGLWDSTNLGLPSSHAAVAMGGAMALAIVLPRTWPVALAAAVGCGATRVLSRAHFLSDVYVGFAVAYAVMQLGQWLWPAAGRPAAAYAARTATATDSPAACEPREHAHADH